MRLQFVRRLLIELEKQTLCSFSRVPNLGKEMSSFNKFTSGLPLHDIVRELNKFADLRLAESWDNVGLLVEPVTPTKINNILLTNDLTEVVMEEALKLKINLIISYHPPIFAPLKRITTATWKERIIATCLENKISVYSPHTSWDASVGGVTDWLIQAFSGEFDDTKRVCIAPSKSFSQNQVCVDVISPTDSIAHMNLTSGGKIISRSECHDGRKLFKIMCSLEDVAKFLEIDDTDVIISKIEKKVDLYTGMGRIITVNGLTLLQCIERLKSHLGLKHLRLALAKDKTVESKIYKVAFVPGSGGSLLKGTSADLYVTGEMSHHELLEANHNGASVILTNHSDSERGFLYCMRDNLQTLFGSNVIVTISLNDKDPIETV